MDKHLYLTVIPEALVASMLEPEDFGRHIAVGSPKRVHGPAIFFEIKRDRLPAHFDLSPMDTMAPHPDGSPKKSQAISAYRVLEHVPLEAFGRIFLVTRTGLSVGISPQPYPRFEARPAHLYQELCPIYGSVVSKLQPDEFGKTITNFDAPVYAPRVIYADLLLGQLADPTSEVDEGMLPYPEIDNIEEAIHNLRGSERDTIAVAHLNEFFFRTIDKGFFVADQEEIIHYPFLSEEEREVKHYNWWRSAETSQSFSPVG